MPVKVRRARIEDSATIIEMANALNRYEGKPASPLTEAGLKRHLFGRGRILSCIIAELDGSIAGYVAYQPSFDLETGSTGFYMSDLFVHEAARRRGIGRALMEWLAREALRRGHSWLAWSVMKTNPDAQAFYRAMGGNRIEVETYSVACERVIELTERSSINISAPLPPVRRGAARRAKA